ncbi:DNA cytosine methyltransferase [Mycolicibacterium fortuitum]|uniref:DNA cytosine methyltransferase n=1 Tax=Mycolicibacterium fortuitum TaxID=1766 RepID=UPI00262A41BF|nr:DNA cytosine methyltransferase [Mycolicibacterium fortuitum]
MKIGSLFSGAGGLDMAVEAFFDGHVVWQCEPETLTDKKTGRVTRNAAVTILAHRFPDVPNLGDITLVDWAAVEPVEVLCGGFPCQDVSAAGLQAGLAEGTRSGLWWRFADAIRALRPKYVVIENVKGLLSAKAVRGGMESDDPDLGDGAGVPVVQRAAGAVLGDLADLGYDAQWVTLSAAAVGAPHKRERVFILAVDAHAAGEPWCVVDGDQLRAGWGAQRPGPATGPGAAADTDNAATDGERARPEPGCRGEGAAADPAGDGRDEGRTESAGVEGRSDAAVGGHAHVALLPTPSVADSEGGHLTRSGARSNELFLPGVARAYGNGDLLPTPKTTDHKHNDSPAELHRNTPSLGAIAHYLPTPSASDGTGGGQHPDQRDGHTRQLCDYALLDGTARWGKYEPAITRWETVTRSAPSPTEPNRNGNPRLAAQFPEWMMGWPAGWVTALVDAGLVTRNEALRAIGNGVCPQQAYAALTILLPYTEVAA